MVETSKKADPRRTAFALPLHAALAAVATLSWANGAAAAPPPLQPVSPFTMVGFIQEATLGGSDTMAGGTITVNGQAITVPRNTIVLMPATALTWSELFTLAPAPYGPTSTGLAMRDVPAPIGAYEATVVGNRVAVAGGPDQYIAGLVTLSQLSLFTSQGFINSIDYATGELRVGGAMGNPSSGQRVRINDPLGRFGRKFSPDVRFTIDEDNPTVRSETAYPMCLPRFDPAAQDDPDCPQANRPIDPNTGFFQTIFTMTSPFQVAPGTSDPRKQMPFQVGDYVTYAGVLVKDGAEPTVAPLPDAASTYVAAYSMIANLGVFTALGTDPAYIALDVTILGVGGAPAPGLPQEATVRTKFEGFSTDPSRHVNLFAIDVDPCTGQLRDRDWGSIDVDQGPPLGAVRGRWRFAPPTKVLSLPSAGTFLPAAREVHAVVTGGYVRNVYEVSAANGLTAGQYHAPIAEYLFPENLGIGNPPVPLNLQDFPFLAKGSGPWAGGGPSPVPGGLVGQLSPWPGSPAPAQANCPVPNPGAAPTANAGANQAVAAGAAVALDGSASTDPNNLALSFAWTQTSGPAVTLSSASVPRPTFVAPSVPGTGAVLGFSLVVTDTAGLASAPAPVTVTVGAPSTAQQPPVANAGAPRTVASGALVHLDGTGTFDPNTPPLALTYAWTQISPLTPSPALTGANTATPTFIAPAVTSPLVMTFHLTVTNALGLGSTQTVNVTVNPVLAPIANAGRDQNVLGGTLVTLNGSASTDPQAFALAYTWTQLSGPPVTLVGANTARPTFVAPILPFGSPTASFLFRLVVSNGFQSSVAASTTVNVVSSGDIVIILTAEYRVAKERLTVTATSSVPSATLTLVLPGQNVPFSLVNGVPTADIVGVVQPSTVTVTSSLGGTATSPLTRVR